MPEPNTILQGRYRIIRQLGRGGMGTVFEAIDERMKCSIVLKRASFNTAERVEDFEREAQLLANLHHPALPKVFDHFVEDGGQYLVMDFVPGNDLAELLGLMGRPFPLTDVLRWADELLRVLEYLHRYSPPILHRDIKPANLKLTRDGEIFLLDFGLAKGAAGQMPTVTQRWKSVPGYTPTYSPLEQILRADNQSADPIHVHSLSIANPEEVKKILQSETSVRSDLYSLGTALYHLMTNEVPINAVRRASYVWNGLSDPMRPAQEVNPLIPNEISDLLESAMALTVDKRPVSASALRTALRDASLSTRLPAGQIALGQLSQQAVESIVQLALERLTKEVIETAQSKVDVVSHRQDISMLANRHAQLAREFQEHLKQKGPVSLKELEPSVIESITLQVVARISEERTLSQLVESIVRKEMPSKKPAEAPSNVAAAIEAGKKAYQEEKRKELVQATAWVPRRKQYGADLELPVPVNSEEERRLHKDARRFAYLLASEIAGYNEEKLNEGRKHGDIYDRIREYIDRSREMYQKRAKPEVAARYDYFHHELVKLLAEGDVSKMGKNYPGEFYGE